MCGASRMQGSWCALLHSAPAGRRQAPCPPSDGQLPGHVRSQQTAASSDSQDNSTEAHRGRQHAQRWAAGTAATPRPCPRRGPFLAPVAPLAAAPAALGPACSVPLSVLLTQREVFHVACVWLLPLPWYEPIACPAATPRPHPRRAPSLAITALVVVLLHWGLHAAQCWLSCQLHKACSL